MAETVPSNKGKYTNKKRGRRKDAPYKRSTATTATSHSPTTSTVATITPPTSTVSMATENTTTVGNSVPIIFGVRDNTGNRVMIDGKRVTSILEAYWLYRRLHTT